MDARAPEDPAYRGVWSSEDAYIREQLAEQLPSYLAWLLDCCDAAKLRAGYVAGVLRVWSVPMLDGRVQVFESSD